MWFADDVCVGQDVAASRGIARRLLEECVSALRVLPMSVPTSMCALSSMATFTGKSDLDRQARDTTSPLPSRSLLSIRSSQDGLSCDRTGRDSIRLTIDTAKSSARLKGKAHCTCRLIHHWRIYPGDPSRADAGKLERLTLITCGAAADATLLDRGKTTRRLTNRVTAAML